MDIVYPDALLQRFRIVRLQVCREVFLEDGHRLIPQFRVLLKALLDDGIQGLCAGTDCTRPLRHFRGDRHTNLDHALAGKRQPAGDQFVQDHPELPDICPFILSIAPDLLRCCIMNGKRG